MRTDRKLILKEESRTEEGREVVVPRDTHGLVQWSASDVPGHELILKEESQAEGDLTRVSFATHLARFDGRPLTFQETRPLPGVSVGGCPAGWERRLGMKAKELTAETLPKALQIMRLAAELTQVGLSRRTTRLDPPFKRVTPNQISDFERGFKRPTSVNLLSIVVGCSPDGATLDLSQLQSALEKASASENETRERGS